MKKICIFKVLLFFHMVFAPCAFSHFGMIIPSDNMVLQGDARTVKLNLSFSHPFEMVGMNLALPKAFKVIYNQKEQSLIDQLKPVQILGKKGWQKDFKIQRPGLYVFYMEPQPYWEPAENSFIIHYTKTYVTAFGVDDDWDQELGLKTEIVPLSKPYALYEGNLFQGIVKMNGQVVPYAKVEIEFFNELKNVSAPTPYMVTQTIKADKNGVFSYAAPSFGWWGFAALNTADFKIKKDGADKDVEIGAVIWVYFHKWGQK